MINKLDAAFTELETAIDTFCKDEDKEEALITFSDAWDLASYYPEKSEIEEAVKLVKQLERYFESSGKVYYEQARRKIEKLLLSK